MNETVYAIVRSDEPVYAIVGSDETPETECSSVSDFSAWKLDEEASSSPPYLYRGRKERRFSWPKKTRWRKG